MNQVIDRHHLGAEVEPNDTETAPVVDHTAADDTLHQLARRCHELLRKCHQKDDDCPPGHWLG